MLSSAHTAVATGRSTSLRLEAKSSMTKPTRGAATSKATITRSVLFRVVDAKTGNIVISGSCSAYPDLGSVGPVVTDLDTGESASAAPDR